MAGFALKVKTKTGQQVLKDLSSETTIQELKAILSELSNIPIGRLQVLSGFPPKVIDLSSGGIPLGGSGITSGDTLILEEKDGADLSPLKDGSKTQNLPKVQTKDLETRDSKDDSRITSQNAQSDDSFLSSHSNVLSAQSNPDSIEANACPGILMKHVVPADNSCLFTSIHYVLNGKDDTGGVAPWMRQLIAESVSKNPEEYSEAILGKPNAEYCKWIKDDKSWGGAIEISILANYYGIEIAVVDTINAIINRFGEDQNYPLRVFLLFDGIHYDPLYLEPLEVLLNRASYFCSLYSTFLQSHNVTLILLYFLSFHIHFCVHLFTSFALFNSLYYFFAKQNVSSRNSAQ